MVTIQQVTARALVGGFAVNAAALATFGRGVEDLSGEELAELLQVVADRVPVKLVEFCWPPATPEEVAAAEAAGLIVWLGDQRVILGPPEGTPLAWPLGPVDVDGRPLPYLRGGKFVVPFTARDWWHQHRGGMAADELRQVVVICRTGGRVWPVLAGATRARARGSLLQRDQMLAG